jgi:hypothetical protein
MTRYLGSMAAILGLVIALFAMPTALAQKPGGVLRMYSPDSPASMSIHEEATVFAEGPMMGVFKHPFGTIKQWMNQGAFLMRGLEKVRAEFSLTALAYNLRRVLNIVGLPNLIAALQA